MRAAVLTLREGTLHLIWITNSISIKHQLEQTSARQKVTRFIVDLHCGPIQATRLGQTLARLRRGNRVCREQG